jgi:large subunit ribosomal protein L10
LAITRDQKEELVEQYKELVQGSSGFIMTSFAGLTVKDMEALRRQISEVGGEFRVVKNTLIERVFNELELELPADTLEGTTAIGFTHEEVVGVAKAIVDLAKEVESVRPKAAIIDGALYGSEQITRLAELPPMPAVQAQLLGLIQTPAQRLAGALAGSVRQVLNVLTAYAEESAPSTS